MKIFAIKHAIVSVLVLILLVPAYVSRWAVLETGEVSPYEVHITVFLQDYHGHIHITDPPPGTPKAIDTSGKLQCNTLASVVEVLPSNLTDVDDKLHNDNDHTFEDATPVSNPASCMMLATAQDLGLTTLVMAAFGVVFSCMIASELFSSKRLLLLQAIMNFFQMVFCFVTIADFRTFLQDESSFCLSYDSKGTCQEKIEGNWTYLEGWILYLICGLITPYLIMCVKRAHDEFLHTDSERARGNELYPRFFEGHLHRQKAKERDMRSDEPGAMMKALSMSATGTKQPTGLVNANEHLSPDVRAQKRRPSVVAYKGTRVDPVLAAAKIDKDERDKVEREVMKERMARSAPDSGSKGVNDLETGESESNPLHFNY